MNNIEPQIGWYLYYISKHKENYCIAKIDEIDKGEGVVYATIISGNTLIKGIRCGFYIDNIIIAETLEQINKILIFQ